MLQKDITQKEKIIFFFSLFVASKLLTPNQATLFHIDLYMSSKKIKLVYESAFNDTVLSTTLVNV